MQPRTVGESLGHFLRLGRNVIYFANDGSGRSPKITTTLSDKLGSWFTIRGSAGPGNPRGVYEVPATGTYGGDRQALLDQIGVPQGGGAGWAAHHVGYDPSTGNMTMQLVDAIVHGFFTHRGGADNYFKATGCKYIP